MKRLKHLAKYVLGMGPKCPIVPINLKNPTYGKTEVVFTGIFQDNVWGGRQSLSGQGSDLEQTHIIMREIPLLLRELGVQSLLDIPCGDFNWMRHVPLPGIHYIGGDIVKPLVEKNQKKFGASNISFQHLNLLEGPLPKVDVVLCRDCLVHFSYADIRRALNVLLASGSRYLLTTHFNNPWPPQDITTGDWRPLNLRTYPFNFPSPVKSIDEGCTQDGGKYADKCLVLWKLADLAEPIHNFGNQDAAFTI